VSRSYGSVHYDGQQGCCHGVPDRLVYLLFFLFFLVFLVFLRNLRNLHKVIEDPVVVRHGRVAGL
jgi:hypothetical protein